MARPRKHPLPEVPGLAYAKAKKINAPQVAAHLGVSRATVLRWHKSGVLPGGVELVPGEVRWVEAVILDWIAEREKGSAEFRAKKADQ